MLIRDQDFWQGQKAEVAQAEDDQETGGAFLKFIEAWCDQAERSINPRRGHSHYLEELRNSLTVMEDALGKLPPRYVGHALIVIMAAWQYGGDELFEAMNPLERHLVGDEIAVVLEALQDQAAGL